VAGDVRDPEGRIAGARPERPASDPGPSEGSGAAGARDDLQSVLVAGLRRLADHTGCERAAAWARGAVLDPPIVVAAILGGTAPRAPSANDFALVAALAGATDVGASASTAALRELAREHGFSAAAPVGVREGEALSVLLLGGAADPPGRVRPRTLAALDAAARRLDAPVLAAAGLARIAKLDEGVRRLDRLAALGEIVAEIVHEVRNPLVSVKTFIQLLPERQDDPDFRTRFSDVVEGELRRIERLLDVVLEHARPRSAAPPGASTDASPVLASVARLLAHRALERGVAIEADAPAGIPGIAIAEDSLRQVVLNLALNAIDVTRDGGTVRLVVRSVPDGVELRVEDEGPGVPLGLRERVFEPFYSTKGDRPGGLGLAISRRIVQEAGGTLLVTDRIGGGAAFRFTLPGVP
jgi:signal transduction histidine kinase